MNDLEVKKLYWKVINAIEWCSDTTITNDKGIVTESGMQLSDDYSAMYNLKDGSLTLYDKDCLPLICLTEESKILMLIKEIFENIEGGV